MSNLDDDASENPTKSMTALKSGPIIGISNQFEIDLIKSALKNSQFNQKKTAEMLGLTYHQLRGYLKKYNLLENAQ